MIMREWINLVENIGQANDVQKYRYERAHYKIEMAHWKNESAKLMAEYNDGSHTKKWPDGSLEWYKNGRFHRDGDKPAVIRADGTLAWWKNGLRHRDGDKPAYIGADGTLEWYKNGQYHRDGDKPAWISADGTLWWLKNGKRSRLKGPAMIHYNGQTEWWFYDERIPVTNQQKFFDYLLKHGHIEKYKVTK